MNDFYLASDRFKVILYADDSTLSTSINLLNADENSINIELDKISVWLKLNKLSLNVAKTKAIIFSSKKTIKIPNIKINSTSIDFVESFNYLGIIIDTKLTWKEHINHITKRLSKTIGILNKLKRTLPQETLKMLYNTLFLPYITYGILCWKRKANALAKIQKKAVRLIVCAKYNAHTSPIFKRLKIFKLSDLVIINELKFCYKLEHNTLPNYFMGLLKRNEDFHNHNTRGNSKYFIPPVKHEFAKNSINFSIPKIYNNYHENIINKINTHSYQGFINYAKSKIIELYETSCSVRNCRICQNFC